MVTIKKNTQLIAFVLVTFKIWCLAAGFHDAKWRAIRDVIRNPV